MKGHKNLSIIFFVSAITIIQFIPSASLTYSPLQSFWTRSLRNDMFENGFEHLEKFLSNHYASSHILLPSANARSYGKWWFLENFVPPADVPVENIVLSNPSSERSPIHIDEIECFMNLIEGHPMFTQSPSSFTSQEEKLTKQRWENIVSQVLIHF